MAVWMMLRLTIREATRRRLVLMLLLLTALALGLSAWGFAKVSHVAGAVHHFELPVIASSLLVLVMFMYSGLLAVGSVFLACASLAGDRESGVDLALLARPIRRAQVYVGKWLGLVLLVAVYVSLTCLAEYLIVAKTTGYMPAHPIWAAALLTGEGAVMVTFGLLLGSRLATMAGGVLGGACFFLAWIAGVVGGIGTALNRASLIDVGIVGHLLLPTDGLWKGAIYSLESANTLLASQLGGEVARSNPFFAGAPPAAAYMGWVVLWVLMVAAIGLWSFARKET